MTRLIDLSHTIEKGMITYKGLPAPLICDHLSREASRANYEAGTEFQIGRIEMVGNTGTYLDSPFHRYADGEDLSEVGLERVAALPGVVVRVPDLQAIDADRFEGRAGLDEAGRRRFGQEGVVLEIGVGAPVAGPAGVDQHRPAA